VQPGETEEASETAAKPAAPGAATLRPLTGRGAIFLAPAGYRQRRLRDALRGLPVLALVLWLLPLFRGAPGAGQGGGAGELIYIFVSWAGLILLAWLLMRRVQLDADEAGEAPEADP